MTVSYEPRNTLIVVRGMSCTGKTRTAYEAIRQETARWRLLQVSGRAELVDLLASRTVPPTTLVWLDDLHHYLDGRAGQRLASTLRGLLMRQRSVVMVGTIWPERFEALTATPTSGPDLCYESRQLLASACTVDVPGSFREQPEDDLRAAAAADGSWRAALSASPDDRLICQTLAAGPDLVDRWRNSPDTYGKAIITAALDLRRAGYRDPVPVTFLRDAAPGYLADDERARARPDWLDRAVEFALTPVKAVISPLVRVPKPHGMGSVEGVLDIADYLEQAIDRDRVEIPGPVWSSIVDHGASPEGLRQVAQSAYDRGLYHQTIAILAKCLEITSDHRDHRDQDALAHRLRELGFDDMARSHFERFADAGAADALVALGGMAKERGDIDESIEFAKKAYAAGNERAFFTVFWTLRDQRRYAEAEAWMRPHLAEWADVARLSANLMAEQGRVAEAVEALSKFAVQSTHHCRRDLARMLDAAGRLEQFAEILGPAARTGDVDAQEWISRVEGWQTRALDPEEPAAAAPGPVRANQFVLEPDMRVWFDLRQPERPRQVMEKARADAEAGDTAAAVEGLRGRLTSIFRLECTGPACSSSPSCWSPTTGWRKRSTSGGSCVTRETALPSMRPSRC